MAIRMNDPSTRRIIRVVTDLICLVVACIPIIILRFAAQPVHRGFYCYDETLMRPYRSSSIPYTAAVLTAGGLPCVTMVITEVILYRCRRDRDLLAKMTIGRLRINVCLMNLYKYIGIFAFGLGTCQSFMYVGKFTIGRLRPHFFDVCKPDFSKINCTHPMSRFVQEYECTETDQHRVQEARMSFPSGHAALSFYAMTYLAMYLQVKMSWQWVRLLRHVIQTACLMFAIVVSVSRMWDNKHHWSDVIAGAVLGSSVAAGMLYCVSDLYKTKDSQLARTESSRKSSSVPLSPFRKSTQRPSRGSGGSVASGENQAHAAGSGLAQTASSPITLQEVNAS